MVTGNDHSAPYALIELIIDDGCREGECVAGALSCLDNSLEEFKLGADLDSNSSQNVTRLPIRVNLQ